MEIMSPAGKHEEMDLCDNLSKSATDTKKTPFHGSIDLSGSRNSLVNFVFKLGQMKSVRYTQTYKKTGFFTEACQDVKITIGNIEISCSSAENFSINTIDGSSVPAKFSFGDSIKGDFNSHKKTSLHPDSNLNLIKYVDQDTMTESYSGSRTSSKSYQTPWVLCSVQKYRPLSNNKSENVSTSTSKHTPNPVTLKDSDANNMTNLNTTVPPEESNLDPMVNISSESGLNYLHIKKNCAVECSNVDTSGCTEDCWKDPPEDPNQIRPFDLEQLMNFELMDFDFMDLSSALPLTFTTPSAVLTQRNINESEQCEPWDFVNLDIPMSGCSLEEPTSSISILPQTGPNYVPSAHYIESRNSEKESTVDISSLGLSSITQGCQEYNTPGVLKRLNDNTGPLQRKTIKRTKTDSPSVGYVYKEPELNITEAATPLIDLLKILNVEKYKPRKLCLYCNKDYSYYYYPKHMKKAHENQTKSTDILECPVCKDMIKGDRVDLNHHLARVHESGLKYYCDVCGKRFKNIHEIREHLATVHKENFIECPICPEKSLPCKRSMGRHFRTEHKKIKWGKHIFVKNNKCDQPSQGTRRLGQQFEP